MNSKIKEILEDVIHWDICPDDYKETIKEYLESLKPKPNKKTIDERKQLLMDKLVTYTNYSSGLVIDFHDYWTEHGENDRKMRFEKEKSFDISDRLKEFKERDNN